MALLQADDLELSWGDRRVLRGATLQVAERERIGLVGPNGCGKSTLMSIFAGRLTPDSGQLQTHGRLAILEQEPEFTGETVADVAQHALSWHRELKEGWEAALERDDLDTAATLQARLDAEGWVVDHRVEALLDQTGAPPASRKLKGLSGGERRRLALAATLLAQPDFLLLDEPTNHLDADTITWLEKYLNGYRGAVLLVTHDRYLLESVAERIVEIEHGECVSYEGSYTDYLLARAERHAVQQRTEDRRLNMLARETAWAARSPSARTGKQKARLKRLEVLKAKGNVDQNRSFELDFSTGLKTGSTVLEAYGLSMSLGGKRLVHDLDLALRPKERIGIVGPNGIGKSTLLRMLSGQLTPDAGQITKGPRIRIGVLDQERTGLKDDDTLLEAAGGGADRVQVGETWVHVAGFLQRLLFGREQLDQRVSGLSGGERARLLLAKKMLEGNAILLLDEPTNDLDLWTLRVLEEALIAFDGTAVIVTHDRAFLDRTCTAVLAFEGDGKVVRYADRMQAERSAPKRDTKKPAKETTAPKVTPTKPTSGKKLSFKERQELEALPEKIAELEAKQAAVEAVLADPATYRDRASEVPKLNQDLDSLTAQIEAAYTQWETLSDREG